MNRRPVIQIWGELGRRVMGVEGHLLQVCLGKAMKASHWLSNSLATHWVLNTTTHQAQHLIGPAGTDRLPSKGGGC